MRVVSTVVHPWCKQLPVPVPGRNQVGWPDGRDGRVFFYVSYTTYYDVSYVRQTTVSMRSGRYYSTYIPSIRLENYDTVPVLESPMMLSYK